MRARAPATCVSPRRHDEALEAIRSAVVAAAKPLDERTLRRLPAVARLGAEHVVPLLAAAERFPEVRRAGPWWWRAGLENDEDAPWANLVRRLQANVGQGAFDENTATSVEREAIRWLVAAGRIVALEPGHYWTRSHFDGFVERVRAQWRPSADSFAAGKTLSELREALGLSRRDAVRCFEALDRAGITVRDGDLRRLRPADER